MFQSRWKVRALVYAFFLGACFSATGCLNRHLVSSEMIVPDVPSESRKVILPDHIIAPPDVLVIDAISLIPRPPYLLKPLDSLFIQVRIPGVKDEDKRSSLVPGQPIEGVYRVDADGTVDLGFDYGSLKVIGQPVPEIKKAVKEHLLKRFKGDFDVTVTLAESRGMQQIRGEHLVQPDGKIVLGTYGSVVVTGLTLDAAKALIQDHLSKYLLDPEISLDIAGFNSRVYYVVFDLDGSGEQIFRLPVTGNETVMDAVAELKGLPAGTSRHRIWVSRPSSMDSTHMTRLPVDWAAITSGRSSATNYQIMPGDRLFVSVDPWIATDNYLAKVLAPVERLLGITLLGNSVVRSLGSGTGGGGTGTGGGF